ncbi:hypothetical protein V2N65_08900, partial [Streptococcus pneumoniae]
KRNHPGSKLRQGFWMVFRFGVNNWGLSNDRIKCFLKTGTLHVKKTTFQIFCSRNSYRYDIIIL